MSVDDSEQPDEKKVVLRSRDETLLRRRGFLLAKHCRGSVDEVSSLVDVNGDFMSPMLSELCGFWIMTAKRQEL